MGFSRRYRDRVEAKPREGLVTGAVEVTCGLLVAVSNLWQALAWDMGSWLTWTGVAVGLLLIADGLTSVMWARSSLRDPRRAHVRLPPPADGL
jgi:hypothetical protein